MIKLVFFSVLCAAILLAPLRIASASDDGLPGFTMGQLNAAIENAGIATQRIYSILTFRDLGDAKAHMAILSGSRSGWHVTVLHNVAGGLEAEWKSGGLLGDFSVSSSDALEIDDLGDEQVVEFSGCAQHFCGGVDGGVFGMVLYAPRVRQAFFAHYNYDERKPAGSFGTLDFSNNAMAAGNERYKAALDKAMRKKLGL
jgi:hypothetical protein